MSDEYTTSSASRLDRRLSSVSSGAFSNTVIMFHLLSAMTSKVLWRSRIRLGLFNNKAAAGSRTRLAISHSRFYTQTTRCAKGSLGSLDRVKGSVLIIGYFTLSSVSLSIQLRPVCSRAIDFPYLPGPTSIAPFIIVCYLNRETIGFLTSSPFLGVIKFSSRSLRRLHSSFINPWVC